MDTSAAIPTIPMPEPPISVIAAHTTAVVRATNTTTSAAERRLLLATWSYTWWEPAGGSELDLDRATRLATGGEVLALGELEGAGDGRPRHGLDLCVVVVHGVVVELPR